MYIMYVGAVPDILCHTHTYSRVIQYVTCNMYVHYVSMQYIYNYVLTLVTYNVHNAIHAVMCVTCIVHYVHLYVGMCIY